MKFIYLTLICALAGCGVRHETVDNTPPKIDHELKGFSSPYGTFSVNQTAVFFWPRGISEDQAQSMVRTINGASEAADPFMIEAASLGVESQRLQVSWDKIDCVGNYALLEPGQDPIDVETVTNWKEDAADQAQLHECQQNQIRRKEILERQDFDRQSAIPYLDTIRKTLDVDPEHPVNSQSLSSMQLTIKPDGTAVVALKDFMVAGFSPSTAKGNIINAVWDSNLGQLSFDVVVTTTSASVLVPDLPVGPVVHFALGRTYDNGPMARFTGEMNLVNGSQILRRGSCRIDAFPPASPELAGPN